MTTYWNDFPYSGHNNANRELPYSIDNLEHCLNALLLEVILDSLQRRKYAQGMRRIELGIWGYPKSLFRAIHLTTREGDDNGSERFIKDYRKLIKFYRSLGFNIEYCVALGYTPQKGLLHCHGLLRVKGGYFPITRRELGDKWNELHGAFAVKLDGVVKHTDLHKYIASHIMKDYAHSGMLRNHFLVSGGWRNGIPDSLVQEVKKWWIDGRSCIWLDSAGWAVVNRICKAYCEKRPVVVKADFGHLVFQNGKVREAVIYENNEKGERIK